MRHETRTASGEPPISPVGHETGDIPYRIVVNAGIIIIVVILVTVFGMRLFMWKEVRSSSLLKFLTSTNFALEPEVQGTKPMLQVDAAGDLIEFRAEEKRQLTTYGWLDRQAGRVRIPIEQAMQLTLQRGLPTRGEAAK